MSERLSKLTQDYKFKNGRRWKEKLCVAADVSISALQKVLCGQKPISEDIAYSVALACGASDGEARQLALLCSSEAKKAG